MLYFFIIFEILHQIILHIAAHSNETVCLVHSQARRPSCHPTNSIKELKEQLHININNIIRL